MPRTLTASAAPSLEEGVAPAVPVVEDGVTSPSSPSPPQANAASPATLRRRAMRRTLRMLRAEFLSAGA
jgi:hypothetical protein